MENHKINNLLFSNFRGYLQINAGASKLIWRPTINFENSLKYERTKTYGNAISNNFWLWDDELHSLEYGEEFQLTFPCYFHLSKFPFDSHECSIYFGDERYSTVELKVERVTLYYGSTYNGPSTSVEDDPVMIEDLTISFGFELEVLPIIEKDVTYNTSQAGILIRVERKSLGLLLSGYYYPTLSFALLSMVSFLIHPDVVCQAKISYLTLCKVNFGNIYESLAALLEPLTFTLSLLQGASKNIKF